MDSVRTKGSKRSGKSGRRGKSSRSGTSSKVTQSTTASSMSDRMNMYSAQMSSASSRGGKSNRSGRSGKSSRKHSASRHTDQGYSRSGGSGRDMFRETFASASTSAASSNYSGSRYGGSHASRDEYGLPPRQTGMVSAEPTVSPSQNQFYNKFPTLKTMQSYQSRVSQQFDKLKSAARGGSQRSGLSAATSTMSGNPKYSQSYGSQKSYPAPMAYADGDGKTIGEGRRKRKKKFWTRGKIQCACCLLCLALTGFFLFPRIPEAEPDLGGFELNDFDIQGSIFDFAFLLDFSLPVDIDNQNFFDIDITELDADIFIGTFNVNVNFEEAVNLAKRDVNTALVNIIVDFDLGRDAIDLAQVGFACLSGQPFNIDLDLIFVGRIIIPLDIDLELEDLEIDCELRKMQAAFVNAQILTLDEVSRVDELGFDYVNQKVHEYTTRRALLEKSLKE